MFWRRLAKSLQIAGGVCCLGMFLAHIVMLAYFYSSRPEIPEPERGWTTGLSWTHPVRYGTQLDEDQSQLLFNLFFSGFGLIISGILIKIYALNDYSDIGSKPNPPWNHRWGP
jgi:hypothetical protein